MNRVSHKALLFTVSITWFMFFGFHFIPGANHRHYKIPATTVWYVESIENGNRHFRSIPIRDLESVDNKTLFISYIPITPFYIPLALTAGALLISLSVASKAGNTGADSVKLSRENPAEQASDGKPDTVAS